MEHVLSCYLAGVGVEVARGVRTVSGVGHRRKGPGALSWGSWAGSCVLGQDHAMLPRQQFHPCASLSSQGTWHYSCEIKISRLTHSRSQLAGLGRRLTPGSGRGAGHSGHSREAPGRRFASISFWEQSPQSREYLWQARCLVSVRGTGGWAGCGFIAPVFVLEA